MVTRIALRPGRLTLPLLRQAYEQPVRVSVDPRVWRGVAASAATVARLAGGEAAVYGVNTGFGILARKRISRADLSELQRRLVLSHAIGTGPLLPDPVVRLILLLKIASLARGNSGVRRAVIDALLRLLNAGVYPCIPAKGSVGASGDLAPLAPLSAALLGVGEARVAGRAMPARAALARAGLKPLTLAAKEGLALLNGTQVSTALALAGLFAAEDVFAAAITAGALSGDAMLASDVPFDPRIQDVRGQPGQTTVARLLKGLSRGSAIRRSHIDCDRVQDPYSLRCQPQVMGACLDVMGFAAGVFLREANAVSDNPLVFAREGEILSGGNFHAQPVAMASDALATAIAEIGALSERRIALLVDANLSALPAFLVAAPGLNSGFMIAQVTAAALASENKTLAHPASVDSLPTSANQEDHVSMAAFAARRLAEMADNTAGVVAVELMGAAQGVDFRKPLKTSARLRQAMAELRRHVKFLDRDRYLAPDLAAAKALIQSGWCRRFLDFAVQPWPGPRA
ncbi:MAG: histidine ammonia-lyase [Alphaproteobacteria bacterium]|nr:histidine ammonia-lyase [Alphaproteobacteria bacterium]